MIDREEASVIAASWTDAPIADMDRFATGWLVTFAFGEDTIGNSALIVFDDGTARPAGSAPPGEILRVMNGEEAWPSD
jgi:hypothetical protein